jgi:tRNA-2-methylthio-N6-dimethylallyladenosine synthase
VKTRRNNELLAVQNAISEEDNLQLLGQVVEVLVEGPSKASKKRGEQGDQLQLVGRTPCDRIVVFEGSQRQVGQIIPVAIYDVAPHTLYGSVVTEHVVHSLSPAGG